MAELLQLTIHDASGLSGGIFGQKDPYVVAHMGSEQVHTTAMDGQGKNPKWEQTFTLVYHGEDRIRFIIFDKDSGRKDDSMGEGSMDLTPLRSQNRWTTSVAISKGRKPAGVLRVTVALRGDRKTRMHATGYPAAIPVVMQPVMMQPGMMPMQPQPGYGMMHPMQQQPGMLVPPMQQQYGMIPAQPGMMPPQPGIMMQGVQPMPGYQQGYPGAQQYHQQMYPRY